MNKFIYLYVIQTITNTGWEDVSAEEIIKGDKITARRHVLMELKDFRENMPEWSHRIIQRRELNPEWSRAQRAAYEPIKEQLPIVFPGKLVMIPLYGDF